MTSPNHGGGVTGRRPSTWALGALALTVAWAGCAGPAASRHGTEVPPLQAFQVRTAQRQLALHGYRVDATGELDEPTRSALLRFQASKALPMTGQLDYGTLWQLGVNPDPEYNCEINDTVDCGPPGH